MKKVFLLAMVALLISGMAWAQSASTEDILGGTVFDAFNVVPAESVELRLSRYVFSSMVDDYINVNFFDPEVGTFVFFGGFFNDNYMSYLTNTQLSFGFARTLNNGYLGLYYGGNIVNASGGREKFDADNDDLSYLETYHDAQWTNNLAVLYGTNNLGAFRFDLRLNTLNEYDNDSGEGVTSYDPGALIGLTWGGFELMGVASYITLGFQLPTQTIFRSADEDKDDTIYKLTNSSGGFFGLQAGGSHDSGIWGDLSLIFNFPTTVKGEVPSAGGGSTDVDIVSFGDGFLAGLRVGYTNIMDLGRLAIGVIPEVNMGFSTSTAYFENKEDKDDPRNQERKDSPTFTNFQLQALVNLGLKFSINEKFDLYTGLGLRFFDWQVGGVSVSTNDGKDKTTASLWTFDGLEWLGSNNLRLGLTFKPVEGLIIGADMSSLLDNFIYINPTTMRVTVFANPNSNNLGTWAASFVNNINLNLTVSYQIPSGGGNAE
jgi:hypothetical protein